MAGKMWAGRFTKEVDERVNDFNSSISFDARMYRYDIEGSMAHATMLGECGIIEKHESEKIVQGLKGILADIDEGKLQFDPTAEDVHMFVEAELTKRLGDTGKRLTEKTDFLIRPLAAERRTHDRRRCRDIY